MNKHTPGPWVADRNEVHAPSAQDVLVAWCGRNSAVSASGSHLITDAETLANARLSAAAPELLTRIKVRVKDCPCVGDADFAHDGRCEECVADIATIAKAEGR